MQLSRVGLMVFAVSLGVSWLCPCTDAQNPNLTPRSIPIFVDASNSEGWKTEIAYLSQSVSANESVILITRRGAGEVSRRLSRQRLEVARTYMHVSRGLEPLLKEEDIITAEGELVRGVGRIEAYVSGKLFMVFVFKRNKNFAPEA